MRLYRVVILANLALATGVVVGQQWTAGEVDRRRDTTTASRADQVKTETWTVKGIVRGTVPEQSNVVITHEPIVGLMGAMTMRFRVEPARLLDGLTAGDLIEFTAEKRGDALVVVAVTTQGKR